MSLYSNEIFHRSETNIEEPAGEKFLEIGLQEEKL
jgi:hypothetical protein